MRTNLLTLMVLVLTGCTVTTHPTKTATLGTARSTDDLVALLGQPGPVELETVASADWSVTRAGLINLEHEKAKAAGLTDGDEPIQIFFHVIRHPTRGLFLVDTGVETALRDAPEKSALSGMVRAAMGMEKMKVHAPLGEWLEANGKPAGVFLTHLHLDHVTGMRDVPNDTPLFTGPGEGSAKHAQNLFVRGSTDRALEGKGALQEWPYEADPSGAFEGALDVFGDGSVWALSVPGHTPGSTAYLVRTPKGPVLLVGDACHTRWGWDNHVEPGSFTGDAPRGVKSLDRLHTFVEAHPEIEVRLGHQL